MSLRPSVAARRGQADGPCDNRRRLPAGTKPLVRLGLGLFVAWAGIALAWETGASLQGWDTREPNRTPFLWRLGTAPVARLRLCLNGVEGFLPPGSAAVFASPEGDYGAAFFRWRWAAYLLSDLQLSPADDLLGWQAASYLIAYRTLPAPPPGASLVLIRPLEGGRLYRIHHP